MLVMSVVRGSVQLGAMTAMSLRICNVELATTTARVTEGLGSPRDDTPFSPYYHEPAMAAVLATD